jgi:hypothetical protein
MPVLARVLTGAVAAMLTLGIAGLASSQTSAALDAPAAKPMTPQRTVWLKGGCSQLVASFDRYGVGRGENSDGPRNHTGSAPPSSAKGSITARASTPWRPC